MWEDTHWKEKHKQEHVEDHLDLEPTEHVETPEPTITTEVKTTTTSKPNENEQKSKILEDKLPGLPENLNLRLIDIRDLLPIGG